VNVTKTQQFTATVSNDAQNKGVTWQVNGVTGGDATNGTISTSGLYTAPVVVPSSPTVTITAISVTDPTRTGTASATVLPAITVAVSPATATVLINAMQNFTATVSNDAQNKGVTWALSGTGCSGATCGTLSSTSSASGVAIIYTAPPSVPSPPTVTLTATSVADGTKTGVTTITVTTSSGPINVTITPKRAGLTVTQSLLVTATVTNDALNQGVTWSATGGSFSPTTSASGVSVAYTAPSSAGVYSITATSVTDGSKNASITIGVTDLAGVTTYHNNLSRDGSNPSEYALTTSNVAMATFGKLFSCPVDAAVYAQPLWIANLNISGGTHNVVFVATSHDTIYAFDADISPCHTYWQKSLLGTNETYVTSGDVNTSDIQPDVGIVGTPVIDVASQILYVVSKSKDSGTSCTPSSSCHQRLHGLSLIDGSEKFGGPATIDDTITVPGNCGGGSSVAFNTKTENQRPGLALVNGVVYISWASHGDNDPYHGWVIGYSTSNLNRTSAFNSSPNALSGFGYCRGGIWMSGGAPAADSSNNLYFITGNGIYDGMTDWGDSIVKLSTASGLSVADWFTPLNQANLDANDTDFGSGGSAILVDQSSGLHPQLLVGAGKEGTLFVIDRTNMGKFNSSTNQVVQTLSPGGGSFATPAFWQNTLFYFGTNATGKAYAFNISTNTFNPSISSATSSAISWPGATPSVSSNASSNGIVWALNNGSYCTAQSSACGATILHAYDATNISTELWNSSQASGNRDQAGNAVKFTVTTIANGKVYVGTRGNNTGGTSNTTSTPGELDVYGLLPN